jgi:hypothetical protein
MDMKNFKILRISQIPKILFRAGIVCILLSCFPACESLPEKPTAPYNALDPNNPNYQKPQVILIDQPDSNFVLTTDQVTFLWEGNQPSMNFRTRLDEEPWSDYSSATSITYTDLDEFDHMFQVQGQYATGDTGAIKTLNFTVDAVKGPALMLLPKRIKINSGSQFILELWVDEIDSIAGISTKLIYPTDGLRVDLIDPLDVNEESFLLNNGGELITFTEINNTDGIAEIDIAVTTGNPRNVIGSGIIANLHFTHISGNENQIKLSDSSKARNNRNENILIIEMINSTIIMK